MIPDAEEILAGYPFVKRRWRIDRDPSVSAVRAAVEDARTLAGADAQTEPAALFFAFGRRPRAFPGAWRLMPALLALNQLRSLDLRLDAEVEGLNRMLVDIAGRKLSFDDVRDWFASRQIAVSGSRTP